MPSRHSISKWIRIVSASVLAVAGASGIVLSWNTGRAQERYFRYKYGHLAGTRHAVAPVDFSKEDADHARLPEVLDACEKAYEIYPENYYFPSYASQQALIAALMDEDEVDFRRHFGTAEHWNKVAFSLNPYDIEICYVRCRILWEKGEREAAIAFWRDTVVAREFWNPDLRYYLVELCKKSGNYSLAAKEARFLVGDRSTVRAIETLQKRRSAAQP